jgi:PAS domain S-box-containing protein
MNQSDKQAPEQDPLAFLAGGGEMAQRIRAFDWAVTPLGPAGSWSPTLKTTVRTLLVNRFPLLLWWGPRYIQLYNDAYRPIPGAKHPKSLGQPASECWPEVWHVIGPLIDTPFGGGPATWMEDIFLEPNRHGFVEETHFTIAYSPVPDDTVPGGIGGVLGTVHEITEKVVGERRMVVLRDLGSRPAESKSAEEACAVAAKTLAAHGKDVPFALLYLMDQDGERARLVGAAGVPPGAAIGPPVVDFGAGGGSEWPFAEAKRTEETQVVADLGSRFPSVPPGPWSDPPNTAVVLPVRSNKAHELAGFLVAGVSARLRFDDAYRGFLELATAQVANAIANARAYEEEKKRAEALAELDRAKTAFFSNVSHEFRTPLTLMLGPVEELLARSHTDLTPAAAGQLEVVNRNGVRLLRLVNTLLDFSRIEAGRVRAVYQPTDLAAFTAGLAGVFRAAVERAGLRLVVDCPPLAEPVYVDREMWEKVVLNLLSNAFKFTFEGEIAVSLRQSGGATELRVRDTGTGIPAEEMPRLFERFHRVQGARGRTHEGSGIGLALVQELVKLHGGSITAGSELGRGTTFTVTLPLGSAHLPPDQVGGSRALASTTTGPGPYVEEALRWLPDEERGDNGQSELPTYHEMLPVPYLRPAREEDDDRPRVLLADDNADMRHYVARLLAERYRIETAPDGAAALAAARRQPPDLVLTDVMMPRLDGFGLLRELRADPRTREVPVIMLSARAGEESRVEGMEAGVDDYLVKPFGARELLARVSAHLQMARLRRETNQSLRYRGEQFETLLNQAPLGVYLVDADFRIREVNPVALPVFGDIPGGVLGRDFDEVIHILWEKKYADEVVRIFRHTLETGESYVTPERAEFRIDRAVTEYYEWRVDRITLPDGRFGLVCYFRDISQHVQARKLIEQSRDALRESEQRITADLEAMTSLHELGEICSRPGGDSPRCLEKILDAAIALTGADKGNLQLPDGDSGALQIAAQRGFDRAFLDFFTEVGRGEAAACGAAMQAARRVVVEDVTRSDLFSGQASLRVLLDAGVRAVQSSPLMSSEGNVLGMISTHFTRPHRPAERELRLIDLLARQAADFLERKQAEKALREADRRKDEFLATLAHELRNPLAPIRNGLQIMRLAGHSREAVEQARTVMERQLGHMVRLIDDLLDLSRISRGKIELRKGRVPLAAVVQQAVETSRPAIEQAGHELTVSVPPDPIYVDADVTRLSQVFSNLLNNAAKFTANGGQVWLTVERRDGEAVVSVRDNGVGIPAHMLPKVFEQFTQVDRSLERSQGGLGIGLTIVKRLVEMHGGSVEAHSDGYGKGSEFVVRLPVVLSLAGEQPPDDAGPARPSARRRILVADDNRDSATSLAMMLQVMGNETRTAFDGLEALDVAAAFRPDVILLDIGMPRLNGYDACRRIREQPWGKDLVLVAVTGWGQDEDRRRSQESGFNSHLVKPVEPADLEKLLAGLQAGTA